MENRTMQVRDMKQRSQDPHDFAMIPRADIPRAAFDVSHNVKQAFNFSDLVPILVAEVLPGDRWSVGCNIVARTSTPIVPIMDNWHLETFFFFCPNRLVWTNWVKFMGEQDNPGDPISYTIPQVNPTGGWNVGSVQDYMGLPTVGQIGVGNSWTHSCLPLRMYNLIFNQWFRDENLVSSRPVAKTDGPDPATDCIMMQRGKRHDYFTSALPFVQKGTAVSLPLGTTAPVKGIGWQLNLPAAPAASVNSVHESGSTFRNYAFGVPFNATQGPNIFMEATTGVASTANPTIYADLSAATAATINQLRQSFQIQKLLERDARGGTRYTEIVRSHFGVISPDARLQRPEYLGGGHIPIITNAVPQTTGTGASGQTTPLGTLAATGHAQGRNGFTYSATEHGYIIGIVNARADLTYQQGLARTWSRTTRYDFYFPAFAMLGEQPVYNREIYCDGSATDANVFGYQERWAEYRYMPSRVAGIYRSTAAGTLDLWHSAQKFGSVPTLNATFITDDSKTVVQRNFALGASSLGQQILADILFDGALVRQMPKYSVPGLVDHF